MVTAPAVFTAKFSRFCIFSHLRITVFCATKPVMITQEILAKLRENEAALRERGVAHAALFGSRVHGDNRPDSDTDI